MGNYILSNEALDDLTRINHNGNKMFGEIQTAKYIAMFFDSFDKIAERPYTFESIGEIKTDCRRCVCGSDTIIFRVSGEHIEIVAIVGRQDMDIILIEI